MSSKNPWDRIFALGKIFKILKGLQGVNMTIVGEKLVKGIYSKKTDDYAYLKRKNGEKKDAARDIFSSVSDSSFNSDEDSDSSPQSDHVDKSASLPKSILKAKSKKNSARQLNIAMIGHNKSYKNLLKKQNTITMLLDEQD